MEVVDFGLEAKLSKMIAAHESETGVKPEVLDVPVPHLTFKGIKVNFHTGNLYYYSCSKEKIVHHWFKTWDEPTIGSADIK